MGGRRRENEKQLAKMVAAWHRQPISWSMQHRQSQVPKRIWTREGRRRRQQPQVPKRMRRRVGRRREKEQQLATLVAAWDKRTRTGSLRYRRSQVPRRMRRRVGRR